MPGQHWRLTRSGPDTLAPRAEILDAAHSLSFFKRGWCGEGSGLSAPQARNGSDPRGRHAVEAGDAASIAQVSARSRSRERGRFPATSNGAAFSPRVP